MLSLINICKNYEVDKTLFPALKNINISFPKKGEFCAILGASGCGKTTLLNIIGGLDKYSSGDLQIEGVSTKNYTDKDWDNYRNKRIGFVFQSYNLIPHLSLLENVELSLTLDGVDKKERLEKAKKALKTVGLENIYNKKPNQLSGGQMQRVAIARALVNDPEIILADEPTGALDSVTSIQVMDLLEEISKTKLVIMVTHNQELANKYATRIIRIKDGEIESDSKPYIYKDIVENKIPNKKEKTSMGFFTALKISLKNLLTKKGRTILTSVASSFGIIGVALVLALSNGFSNYIERIESQTASMMPVNISAYTAKYTQDDSIKLPPKFGDTNLVYPYISNTTNVTYKYNNFNEKYLNYLKYLRDDKKYLNDYIISYGNSYSFNLMTDFPDGSYKIVNNKTNISFGSMLNSVTGVPTTLFHVLYGEEKYITETYDLIDGTYPQNENELVLVIDQYNRISPTTLIELGFYGSDVDPKNMEPIKFSDLYNKKFKIFSNDEFYKETKIDNSVTKDNYNHDRSLYTYKAAKDYKDMFVDDSLGMELKITGVLRPSKNSTIQMMASGLCYTTKLQEKLTNENKNAPIANNFSKNYSFNKVNPTTNDKYVIDDVINDLTSLFNKLKSLNDATGAYKEINSIINKYFTFYAYDSSGIAYYTNGITSFLNVASNLGVNIVQESLMNNGLNNMLYIQKLFNIIKAGFTETATEEEVTKAYDTLISLFGYINTYSSIQSIIVFPKDLSSKSKLLSALNSYNEIKKDDPHHASNEQEQVYYTDIAGEFTDGLGQMINVISIVLIIFASISLLVSCVMTGIITYVSVIERTKEIGILRAVGARKKDVGRLFEAESCIIGGLAGIIGCLFAYIVCFPINQILNHIYPEYNLGGIASLNPLHALILIIISILLTFFSGLIPARVAAKKDPVIALRSE